MSAEEDGAEVLLERKRFGGEWLYFVRSPTGAVGVVQDEWRREADLPAALVAAFDAANPRPAGDPPPLPADAPPAAAQTNHRLGCAAMLGEASPRPLVDLTLPGADQLQLDGGGRREVHHYARKEEPKEREWKVSRVGGHHDEMHGRGEAWLTWARSTYSFSEEGWLVGDLSDPRVPRAARFWMACDAKLRAANREPNAVECAFVFDRLLHLGLVSLVALR